MFKTTLDGEFALEATGAAPDPHSAAAVDERLAELLRQSAPVDLGGSVAAFRGGRADAPGALTEASAQRLHRLQRYRDPSGRLIRAMQVGGSW